MFDIIMLVIWFVSGLLACCLGAVMAYRNTGRIALWRIPVGLVCILIGPLMLLFIVLMWLCDYGLPRWIIRIGEYDMLNILRAFPSIKLRR
jgi:hypothetical protein